MIKRILKFIGAVFFPWLVLLLNDNPGGALIALLMQASILGWLPASMWAFRVLKEGEDKVEQEDRQEEKTRGE